MFVPEINRHGSLWDCEKAEEEAWKWNADFKMWVWGKACESRHLPEQVESQGMVGEKLLRKGRHLEKTPLSWHRPRKGTSNQLW